MIISDNPDIKRQRQADLLKRIADLHRNKADAQLQAIADMAERWQADHPELANAKPKAAAHYHHANEEPPELFRDNGPIEGPKNYLASLVFPGTKADRRTLDSAVRDNMLWGQRIRHHRCRIWFQSRSDFLRAKEAHDTNQRRGQRHRFQVAVLALPSKPRTAGL